MAIKKSQLYSSIWEGCNELRGGMDASQYKDYVLVLLFIKYISDKYASVEYAPITIPKGSSFKDMVALKGDPKIGEKINTEIIAPLSEANKLSEMPDFDNAEKLGSGPDMVKKLSNLIAIFENPALDFSKNRAGGDDLLGDAYEYLMKHFATQSGKSKGQFYTPAEVSRIIARVIGIDKTTNPTPTVYDPTCGSGSLLLKIADETNKKTKLYGQEMDNATAALARMNMILHNNPTAIIKRENTLSTPLFLEGEQLKTFDFVVANPPFSFKSWSNGVNISEGDDYFKRFKNFGIPPAKNGDYAFLLHIIKSLKTTGKGACILPHGVLFRGNAEATIRTKLIRRGYIKGIIGLPANLFYGTGIPACIIVLDKENAENRKGIFMINASNGFVKDGNKNRLRTQDLHKIVDVFNNQRPIDKYSKMVSIVEIEKNEFNLNISRYIDSKEEEDIQNIEAHLKGDIPTEDINHLQKYWDVYPTLKESLFGDSKRERFNALNVPKEKIKETIFSHPEFLAYSKIMGKIFGEWKEKNITLLKQLEVGAKPKEVIHTISEEILEAFSKSNLIDKYDIYKHLMGYWAEIMQDDMYLIAVIGWVEGARTHEIFPTKDKNNKTVWGEKHDYLRGKRRFKSDIIPSSLLINKYYSTEQATIESFKDKIVELDQELNEIVGEHGDEEGLLNEVVEGEDDKRKLKEKTVKTQIKKIVGQEDYREEYDLMEKCVSLFEKKSRAKKELNIAKQDLEDKLVIKYSEITESEIKELVVKNKWLFTIEHAIKEEMDRISQKLTQRIKELAERYETPLPLLNLEVEDLNKKVDEHLKKMGFKW